MKSTPRNERLLRGDPGCAVLASRNPGKLEEMRALLAPVGWTLRTIAEFTAQTPAETASTFVENALIKARHAATVAGLPALADDSGLAVDALQGAPGVHSARFAGAAATDAQNNALLLARLRDVPAAGRAAHYVCALVFMRHATDPEPVVAQARWSGRIAQAPRGYGGFGYDPLFLVDGGDRTAAELPADEKHRLSHRGQAARALAEQLARA